MTTGKLPWIVFLLMLAFAIAYVIGTVPDLPPMVASHFDAAGYPNAFMTRSHYTRFILGFAGWYITKRSRHLRFTYSKCPGMRQRYHDKPDLDCKFIWYG